MLTGKSVARASTAIISDATAISTPEFRVAGVMRGSPAMHDVSVHQKIVVPCLHLNDFLQWSEI